MAGIGCRFPVGMVLQIGPWDGLGDRWNVGTGRPIEMVGEVLCAMCGVQIHGFAIPIVA